MLAGRYRLAYRIAAGAAGEVWRGLDAVLDRPVAVKLLRASCAGQPEALARFRAEAWHTSSLSHPAIAQVYDYGEADPPNPAYLVMEVVDGPSLAGVLASGPLDPARAMDVVAQAAAGLAAAHEAGLVHRDIKPANLLLGPGGTLKITDFGFAYAAGTAPLTMPGMLVGTPAYLAPERAAGSPAVPASDLYSLGIVAYECLTGAAPFHGSPLEVAAAQLHHVLPPLPQAVPGEVAALVAELTAKDPADRLASAAAAAGRAGRLRDAITAEPAAPRPAVTAASPLVPLPARAQRPLAPPARSQRPPAPPASAPPVSRAGTRPADPAPVRRHRWREWPGRRVGLAVAAAIMAAGLAGALLGSLPGL
jgi:serine/threonine-protein kinase